jgi:hypothetical protein
LATPKTLEGDPFATRFQNPRGDRGRRHPSPDGVDECSATGALRRHVPVEQLLTGPPLQHHQLVGVVQTLEQLVLLAAFFLLGDRLQGLEGAGEAGCLPGAAWLVTT